MGASTAVTDRIAVLWWRNVMLPGSAGSGVTDPSVCAARSAAGTAESVVMGALRGRSGVRLRGDPVRDPLKARRVSHAAPCPPKPGASARHGRLTDGTREAHRERTDARARVRSDAPPLGGPPAVPRSQR